VHVSFFEMPLNSQLENTVKAKMIRSHVSKIFPPSAYYYIPLPDSANYVTRDGLHLSVKESMKYTPYFRTKMQRCADNE